MFILGKFRSVMKTEEGEVKVVSGYRWKGDPSPMHIGLVDMEPNTLLVPQYVDANLVIFVRRGHAKMGWICKKGKMAESRLRAGDVTVIPAGSAFYLINDCKDERLQAIASIDSTETLGFTTYQSFFIGGGRDPTSILSGFDPMTIASAFNVTMEELGFMMSQAGGPIIRMHPQPEDANKPNEDDDEDSTTKGSIWQRIFNFILGGSHHRHHGKNSSLKSSHAYNLYDKKPDFRNSYGSSVAVDESEYAPLKHTGISVYFVNLTAGSMMAPHVNPSATEYGIILDQTGEQ
ncbi:vicilin-like seed storage protein At2g28490 [Asparagus officinalis]|uniref:vicilin-like seed storage protein At2g28490 n=1 Tax=Asparagus officinalis TaxID=4686 RepID=UPI00098DF865|nr:vicilin-like seed storage protein At2g28490 [Asparagus officinalis]